MSERTGSAAGQQAREMRITRVFDAPRSLVWKVWTEPEHMMRWWGPKCYTAPFCKIDLRPGGFFLAAMRSPEGRDFWTKGTYREIVEPERLVYTDVFADEKGNQVPASHYGLPGNWPDETMVTVTFAEQGSKTKVTLLHAGLPAEMSGPAEAGWNQSLDKFAEALAMA
jgi:uncharacterized protein YndB with AHSA1/START domain